jgi:hypothetical protein
MVANLANGLEMIQKPYLMKVQYNTTIIQYAVLILLYMQIYISAIKGYVPTDIICAFHVFMDFCYLVQHATIDEKTLDDIDDALHHFYHYHSIFQTTGV